LCLRWIAFKLDNGARLADCRAARAHRGELFRTDAKAEGNDVVIGGWECLDGATPSCARWFSVRLTAQNTPWLHCKGEPFKVIAALELLATLFGIIAFMPSNGDYDGKGIITGSATTDNLGVSYVVAKLMTTAFPLNAVLMEVAEQLDRRGSWLALEWAPRQQNVEADALTNEDFHDFDPARRIVMEPESMDWILMPAMMEAGGGMIEEIRAEKERRKRGRAERRLVRRKKLAGDGLKDRHPW